jgi:hypothetical protein
MAVLTKNLTDITQAVVDLLEADQSLGLKKVWYGDQDRVPFTPCATVESGPMESQLTATGFFTTHEVTIYVMLYFAKITSQSELKKEADEWAEKVRDTIHKNKTLNGIVIHGNVTLIEPGIARRGGAKLRGTRMTVRYLSRTQI